jgi:hypothetical protein
VKVINILTPISFLHTKTNHLWQLMSYLWSWIIYMVFTCCCIVFFKNRWNTFFFWPAWSHTRQKQAIIVFKCFNCFKKKKNNKIQYLSDRNPYSLRNVVSEKLHIPKAKTELFKKTFTYSWPKLWNELPFSIRQASSHNSCLNRGSDGAMGSWSNINLAVLFCNLRMRLSPSFEQFPQTTQQ